MISLRISRCNCSRSLLFLLVYLTCLHNLIIPIHTFVPKDGTPSSSHLQHSNLNLHQARNSHHVHPKLQVSALETENDEENELDEDEDVTPNIINISSTKPIYPINSICYVDATLSKVLCQGLRSKKELPRLEPYFQTVESLELVNVSSKAELRLEDLYKLFPNVRQLSINHSPRSTAKIIGRNGGGDYHGRGVEYNSGEGGEVTQVTLMDYTRSTHASSNSNTSGGKRYDSNSNLNATKLVWESVRQLNLSWNELTSDAITLGFLDVFPNLEGLDISHNFVSKINISLQRLPYLKSMDISGNPLDCTSDLYWLENHNIELLHSNQTLCDLPPHQNKAKPIWKVIRLIKKVREECKVNCSCDIAYIWEQNHVIHSKTLVNCSNRGFTDFPDPDKLPRPTDTLDLSNNQITSIKKFVEDERYTDLLVMNLYLDSNRISSINLLEGSEWFYNFQVFTIRNNTITELPVYVLENVFLQNRRILQIDLSLNDFKCECLTVSTLKVWLLRYSSNIKDIDDIRCSDTKESIRYIKREDWCTIDDGEALIDVLDILSIAMALIIVLVVGKVYYDYWRFKTTGALPWIVRKM